MSAFRTNIIVVDVTEQIGFGATLNADGSISAITGPTLRRVTGVPANVDNAGSLALRTNGTLYVTTGAGAWFPVGGASGWHLPDDVSGIWGTAVPGQVSSTYVSAANRWDLQGDNTTDVQASTAYRLRTGLSTATAAVVGGGSGLVEILTGATTATIAGATAGASGAINLTTGTTDLTDGAAVGANTGAVAISTGNALSTAGVSGSTGNISLVSGNSADANSGNIVFTTGTAAGTRGIIDVNATQVVFDTQATSFVLIDANAAALSIGAAGATNMLVFDTSNAAEELVVNAVGGLRAVNNVPLEVGTTVATDVFAFSYQSGTNQGQIVGTAIVAGGATTPTRPFALATGARTKNDADPGTPASGALSISTGQAIISLVAGGATGGASGDITVVTGATDSQLGANTAGNTGALALQTGNALSTLGTSGNSGLILVDTGDSADANTGNVTVSTGNAAAVGAGITSGNVDVLTGTVGGTGTTGAVTLTTGNPAGAGVSGPITSTTGTTTGAANTGLISLTTGGTGTGTTGNVGLVTGSATGAGTSGNIALTTGNIVGAGTSGSIVFTPGTAVGGTVGTIQAVGRLTTTDGVAAGTVRVVGGLAYRTTADSATITNTTVETAFSTGVYTVPADTLKQGTQIRVRAWGVAPSTVGTNTLTIALRFGAAGVAAQIVTQTSAVDVANGDTFVIDIVISIRTVGAGGTMIASSQWQLGVPDTATCRADRMASAAINTTVVRDLTLTADWSAAATGNQVILEGMSVWID